MPRSLRARLRLARRELSARCFLVSLSLFCVACSGAAVSGFSWLDASGAKLAFRQSENFPEGSEGLFNGLKLENRYYLEKAVTFAEAASLELELRYVASGGSKAPSDSLGILVEISSRADGREPYISERFFLRDEASYMHFYLTPGSKLASLRLRIEPSAQVRAGEEKNGSIELRSIRIAPPFHGLDRRHGKSEKGVRLSSGFSLVLGSAGFQGSIARPFEGISDGVDDEGRPSRRAALFLEYGPMSERGSIFIGSPGAQPLKIALKASGERIALPAALFGREASALELRAPSSLDLRAFFTEAVDSRETEIADFGVILRLPPADPKADFDLYRWTVLPSVLVFDFKDYAAQDRYLKRLAFFVEKKGFKGRLARDSEIATLHGWNAHDYRPEDLAVFFNAASARKFILSREELELAQVLLARGVLHESSSGFMAGSGAIISISRESAPNLRNTFLIHESTHALFFADPDYRNFVRGIWQSLPEEEKWFWKLYFGWMNYDTTDSYLMANELQAYLLQQSLVRVEEYFTKILPDRLLENHPELAEPIRTYMESYGTRFHELAARLENRLTARYGIGAGRASFVGR